MKQIIIACNFMLLLNFAAHSQGIDKGCFYIQASGYYRYLSIVQTYDGGYAIGGLETGFASAFDQNFWVIKIDDAGNILWSSSLGTTAQDGCYRVIETSDHKIVAAGFAGGSSNQDFFIVKYDEDGTILWKKNIDHPAGNAFFKSIIETSTGEYILTGVIGDNAYLIKIGTDGSKVWSTEINDNGIYSAQAESVVASTNGGYLISGWGIVPGAYFTHVNEDGIIQWSISYNAGVGFDAIPLVNGEYLISGYESGIGQPHPNAFVTKIDSNGEKVWSKTYGGDGSETFYGLSPTSDGGFIGAGIADTGAFIPAGAHGFVAKCNSEGEIEWSKNVYSAALLEDVIQTSDGGYALLGSGSVIKLDANGKACDECLLEDFGTWMVAGDVAPKAMFNYTADDSIFNPTYTLYTGGTKHALCVVTGIEEAPSSILFSITPNPADQLVVCLLLTFPGSLQLPAKEIAELRVFDAIGKLIYQSEITPDQSGPKSESIIVSSWQNGIYFCELQAGSKVVVSKLIIQH